MRKEIKEKEEEGERKQKWKKKEGEGKKEQNSKRAKEQKSKKKKKKKKIEWTKEFQFVEKRKKWPRFFKKMRFVVSFFFKKKCFSSISSEWCELQKAATGLKLKKRNSLS